jgi:hypothetical protein
MRNRKETRVKALILAVALAVAAPAAAWADGAVHHNQSGDTKNVNKNSSKSVNKNANVNKNTNRNNNRSTGVGVGVGSGSANTNVTVEGDREQIAPAYAPGLVAAPETCMGSVAGGGSFLPFGLSFGTTYKSNDCELRMFARSLQSLGHMTAATLLLATNEEVAKALIDAGYPLPDNRRPKPKVVVQGVSEYKADGQ